MSASSESTHATTRTPDRGTVSLRWFLGLMFGAIVFLIVGSVIADNWAKGAPFISPLVTVAAVVIALAYRYGAHRKTAVSVTAGSLGLLAGISYSVLYDGAKGADLEHNLLVGGVGVVAALLAAGILVLFDGSDDTDRRDSKPYVALGAFVLIFASTCDFASALSVYQ